MTGIAGSCACTASGHAAAAPEQGYELTAIHSITSWQAGRSMEAGARLQRKEG
jgi:hypothetical protein